MKPKIRMIQVYGVSLLFFLGTLGFDRWSKNWIQTNLYQSSLPVFSFLQFVYVQNKGAVFGLFSNSSFNFSFLGWISIITIFVIMKVFLKKIYWIPLSFLLGGAIGNIWDRHLYGYVIDFIKVGNFYVFNVADAFICIGGAILFIIIWFDHPPKEETQKSNE